MEFEITAKTKKKAKRRRVKNEKKWRFLRGASFVSFWISIISFVIGVYVIDYEESFLVGVCGVIFSVFLILFVIFKALIANMASHWIDDRLNERIWVEDGKLYQFIQISFAAGLNIRHADERATVYIMDLHSVRNAKYDSKSGRIEFNTIGKGIDYADYQTNKVERQWDLPPEFTGIFYDYTNPSLYEYLKSIGITFEEETIDFKIRDGRI